MTTYSRLICLDCKHYDRDKSLADDNEEGIHYCPAYPDGIPLEIEGGADQHKRVRPDQQGDYVFTDFLKDLAHG